MLKVSENQVKFYTRAKYYKTPSGEMKLAKIQEMSYPAFRIPGYEECKESKEALAPFFDDAEELCSAIPEMYDESSAFKAEDNSEANRTAWKNLYRAKIKAFDKILCNHDLDTFVTFTISPESVGDRASWEDVYHRLKVWLSDRVQRRGLKYVICPERHKRGGIHFHAIMNSKALKLTPATNAHTGTPIMHNGQPLYNVKDFKFGFTSAELIQTQTLDREKVAKYIFKYMGKQGIDGKIGGRYALIGGELASPHYLYGGSVNEFLPYSEDQTRAEAFYRESEHEGIKYREWSFI